MRPRLRKRLTVNVVDVVVVVVDDVVDVVFDVLPLVKEREEEEER